MGTSFLEAEGDDFYNTFVLVGPTGREAGRVRKQTPAMYEPWFFRGQPGSHVIETGWAGSGSGSATTAIVRTCPRSFSAAGPTSS